MIPLFLVKLLKVTLLRASTPSAHIMSLLLIALKCLQIARDFLDPK